MIRPIVRLQHNPSWLSLIVLMQLLLTAGCSSGYESAQAPSTHDYDQAVQAFEHEHNYNDALSHALQFIKQADGLPRLSRQVAECQKIVGSIYFFYADYVSALDYFEKSYHQALQMGDTNLQAANKVNMLFCHLNFEHYDVVEHEVDDLLKIEVDNPTQYRYLWNCLRGDLDEMHHNGSKHLAYYRRAIEIARDPKVDIAKRGYPYARIAYHHLMLGHLDSAAHYMQHCYDLAVEGNDTYTMTNATSELMSIYTSLGQTDRALEYQEKYMMLSDSLMNRVTYAHIRSIHDQIERSESDRHIRSLVSTVSKQNLVLLAAGVILAIVMLFLYVVTRQHRRLMHTNRALYERNRELAQMELQWQHRPVGVHHPVAVGGEQDVAMVEQQVKERPSVDSNAVTQSAERDSQLIERILDIMENTTDYCDPDFGVTQLTTLVGSNINYVPRVIKARLGKSVPMLVNEYRIREARRRMLDKERYGNYTLQAIAESVGFKSQNNFIAMFKRMTGITPSLYLKMSQDAAPTDFHSSED